MTYRVTRYRDGLLIALLISRPMRLKNLAGLVIASTSCPTGTTI
jgi:hypothetical protein